jgi:guanine deaminase
MSRDSNIAAHRGALLNFHADPGNDESPDSYDYFEDGMLVVADGRVVEAGPAAQVQSKLGSDIPTVRHERSLILPGFIDTHIHYPQTDVIGSGGRQLLDWLNDYTFPAEARFADAAYAKTVADFFLDELLASGTTTAMVYCTVHRESVDAFFDAAAARGARMIAGKVLMDRNCPDYLRDTPQSGEFDSRELIERWHAHERLSYALTPRFAATSSEAQLASVGRMAQEFPDVYVQTHLAENHAEIAWIKELFPRSRSYLDVYDSYGLLRERAVYAHCIHLNAIDRGRMASTGATAAFCPTSNLYLGSGLFDIAAADAARMRFSMATDVGGGTSFSMLRTLGEGYKVAQMSGQRLPPLRAFYLATLGAARALGLEHRIGRFAPGSEADFIVLDRSATALISRRMQQARTLSAALLIWMTLGDERSVASTYVLGQRVRRTSPIEQP